MFVDIDEVAYSKTVGSRAPFLEGVYVGSRIGILVSKYGLGCGWNRSTDRVEAIAQAAFYDVQSAGKIGVNLAAYIVGYAEVGLVEGRPVSRQDTTLQKKT